MNARTLTLLAGIALSAPLSGQTSYPVPPADAQTKAAPVAAPAIDVVFVLDTTGSMSGLIEGAKQKIWAVANQIILAKPRPDVRMGLVGYRDRGDVYITTLTPLTADLDGVYSALMAYSADGGGDGPESVNQALAEAVSRFGWAADPHALKLIYLVGDAPPHMDYEQDQKYQPTCEEAAKMGIIVNTIQCGGDPQTTAVWREVARLAEGEFFQIEQNGGVAVIETPFDADLARLGAEIDSTLIAYGDEAAQEAQRDRGRSNLGIVAAAPASAQAERAVYKSAAAGDTLTGRQELVRDLEEKKVDLKDIPEAQLPPELRDLPADKRAAFIQAKGVQRAGILTQIEALRAKRQTYLDQQAAVQTGKPESFDARVLQALTRQAAAKGIVYAAPVK